MFAARSYTANTAAGSSMNGSSCAASAVIRFVMDTVLAVSIFVCLLLGLSLHIIGISVIILAILGLILVLSILLKEFFALIRPNTVPAQ